MHKGCAAEFKQPAIYRELVRAIREVIPALAQSATRDELELLALRYQRLAQFRQSVGRLGARHLLRHRALNSEPTRRAIEFRRSTDCYLGNS